MSYKILIEKLQAPWKFSTLHIFLLAYTLRIDPEVINRIIQREALEVIKGKVEGFRVKEREGKVSGLKGKDNGNENKDY